MIVFGILMRSIVIIISIDVLDRVLLSFGWEDRRRISIIGLVVCQLLLCLGWLFVCFFDNFERFVGNEIIQKFLSFIFYFVEEEVVQFYFGINEFEVDQQIYVFGL